MKSFRFDTKQTFDDARRIMRDINNPSNSDFVARLKWLEGSQAGQSVSYRWDPMAERFGHQIDKEPLDREIVYSLLSGIPVEVSLQEVKPILKRA